MHAHTHMHARAHTRLDVWRQRHVGESLNEPVEKRGTEGEEHETAGQVQYGPDGPRYGSAAHQRSG